MGAKARAAPAPMQKIKSRSCKPSRRPFRWPSCLARRSCPARPTCSCEGEKQVPGELGDVVDEVWGQRVRTSAVEANRGMPYMRSD
eukprot:12952628-Alexandrium_andersonii.AAC.1